MKKAKLIFTIGSFLFMGMTFTACDSSTTAEQSATPEEQTETVSEVEYRCPMNCEPDKEYHEPGKCPVCQMDLREVKPKS